MKRMIELILIVAVLLTLTACGSKDALAGTWSAELGEDASSLGPLTGKTNAPWRMPT